MTNSLLPPNTTALDRAAEAVIVGHLAAIDQPHRALWNPDTCPLELLPWLAWQLSVDEWSESWPQERKRNAIKQSIALHRKRGTPWAVRQAVQRVGVENVQLAERITGAHWAEFDLVFDVREMPLTEETIARAIAQVNAYKAARSHLRRLTLSLSQRVTVARNTFCVGVEHVTVYPRIKTELTAMPIRANRAVGMKEIDTVEIHPQ